MSQNIPDLTPDEQNIIRDKGTEAPFSGFFWNYDGEGTYCCRQCGRALFDSDHKFFSKCGWPSFDGALDGMVEERPDADGCRTEIVCRHCGGHLGHVFLGEELTAQNTRYCVNSKSLTFKPAENQEIAVFAGGCFWGIEDYFKTVPGVIQAVSGYTGGHFIYPAYEDVANGETGHAEAVMVIYDPQKISFEDLAITFFEIHDPTQLNRQGPDFGSQYRSAIFYASAEQKNISEKLISILKSKGYPVVTSLSPLTPFYPAEEYHQNYFQKTGHQGCHRRVARFK